MLINAIVMQLTSTSMLKGISTVDKRATRLVGTESDKNRLDIASFSDGATATVRNKVKYPSGSLLMHCSQ